jgi:hypothetical protein
MTRRWNRCLELILVACACMCLSLNSFAQDEDPAPPLPETTIPSSESTDSDEPIESPDPAETTEPADLPEPSETPDAETSPAVEPEAEAAPPAEQPTAPTEEPAKVEKAEEPTSEPAESKGTHVTGRYKIHIGGAKPKFTDKFINHDKYYGKTNVHPQMYVDYLFFDWYATLGVNFGLGYYRDEDKAAAASGGEADSSTELVAIPVQANVVAQFVPSRSSFLSLSVWTGLESIYVQESIHPKGASTDDTTDKASTTVFSGWNTGRVVGAGLGIRLDPLESTSVSSLEFLGIGSVYLTPYIEQVQTINRKMMDMTRASYGILFTFETLR